MADIITLHLGFRGSTFLHLEWTDRNNKTHEETIEVRVLNNEERMEVIHNLVVLASFEPDIVNYNKRHKDGEAT